MPNFTISPNMSLTIPTIGQDSWPDAASNLNASLTLIDSHDHSSGSGVQITPAGLNINADLTFQGNNLTTARSLRLSPQSAVLSAASDLGCLYEVGNDLYFNDGLGNQVRITQSGGVAGSPGSIANLASPASASYVSANSTFVWQSAASTPANMDAASYILRNLSASSFGLTLSPPTLSADYTLTLPTLPVSGTKIVQVDNTGAMSASLGVDGSTIQISSNQLKVPTGGITATQIASGTITATQIANATITGAKMVSNTVTGTQIAINVDLGGLAPKVGGQNIVSSSANVTNGLAIVRGIVGSLGNIPAGEGFSVIKGATGSYTILYDASFVANDDAVVTATMNDPSVRRLLINITGSTEVGFSIEIQDLSGNPIDASFSFIAIGQRD